VGLVKSINCKSYTVHGPVEFGANMSISVLAVLIMLLPIQGN